MATALDMRTLSMADAEALSAAFDSIGWDKPAEQFVRYVAEAAAVALISATVDGEMAG